MAVAQALWHTIREAVFAVALACIDQRLVERVGDDCGKPLGAS